MCQPHSEGTALSNIMYQYAPGQDTAAFCVWLQLWMPISLWGQSVSLVSVPAQVMLLRRMGLTVVSFTRNDCMTAGAVETKDGKLRSKTSCWEWAKYWEWAILEGGTIQKITVYKALPVPFFTHNALSFTFSCKPKLPADHCSISCVPVVITNCAPLSSDADFHSTFIFTPSSS